MRGLERPAGLAIAEKLMGFLLLVIGALSIYYSLMAMEALGGPWAVFTALGVILALVGLALVLAKAE